MGGRRGVGKSAKRPTPSPDRSLRQSAWDAVYELIRKIPAGRVATYGQIAELLGGRMSARAVGWALHVCPADVPWHRVVNASGRCSTDRLGHIPAGLQLAMLKSERAPVRRDGSVRLEMCRWEP